MFIRRESKKKNTVANSHRSVKEISTLEFVPSRDIEISQYPVLSFLIGLSFIGLSIYFIYSVSGGVNSIEGFNNQHWWQYIIALIPSLFGFFFLFTCETQTVIFSRKDNYIKVERKYFCCIYASDNTQKEFSDLVGISVVSRGTQKVNISTATYYIVLSFKTCEEAEILGCKSSIKILQYFQQIRKMFSTEQISHKKVVIQNMLDS